MDSFAVTLDQIIQGILTPQQEVHQQAQNAYFAAEQSNPAQLVLSLATILKSGQNLTSRVFAAVILRQQSFPQKQLLNKCDVNVIQQVKAIALELFQSESNPIIRNKVIEFCAVFASRLFKQAIEQNVDPAGVWPELLDLTFHGCKIAEQPMIQQACFNMLASISEYCVQALLSKQQMMEEVLSIGLQAQDFTVSIAAANALLSILISSQNLANQYSQPNLTPQEKQQYAGLVTTCRNMVTAYSNMVPQCCQILALAVENNQDALLAPLIDNLDAIVLVYPEAFAKCFGALLQLINKICRNEDIDDAFKSACLSILTSFSKTAQGRTLARNSSKASKKDGYEAIVLSLAFDLLQDIDDSDVWSNDPMRISEDEEEFPNHYLGLFLIQPLPQCLGLKTFVPTLITHILKKASNFKDWKGCHAALRVFQKLAEEHLKAFPKESTQAIYSMFISLSDPRTIKQSHPRVAVALFESMLAFMSKMNQKNAKLLVPNLMHYIATENIKLYPTTMLFYAIRAVSSQVGILSSVQCQPFAEGLLTSCVALLNQQSAPVKNASLGLISILAYRLGEKFLVYADAILQGLCSTLQQINTALEQQILTGVYNGIEDERSEFYQQRTVKNKIIETLSFIAEALGAEVFNKYAMSCMQLIAQAQQVELKCASPSLENIFAAYTKISECLGEDFSPYLQVILPGILQAAAAKDFSFRFDVDSEENLSTTDQLKADDLMNKGFSTLTVGVRGECLQRLYINPAIIQDKVRSLEMLGEFAIALKDAFLPFLLDTAKVVFPECTSTINPRLRWSATCTIPALLECYLSQKDLTKQQGIDFFTQCMASFDLGVWVSRELPHGLNSLLNAVTASLDALITWDASAFPQEAFVILGKSLKEAWALCLERRGQIELELLSNGDEEHMQLRAESMAVENSNLDACVALNTQLLRCGLDTYWPIFEREIEPLFAEAINLNLNAEQQQQRLLSNGQPKDLYLYVCGVVGYADMIGTSRNKSTAYIEKVYPIFLKSLTSEDPLLRRGACFGITATHRTCSMQQFAPFVEVSAKTLCESVKMTFEVSDDFDDDDETEEDNKFAQDNGLAGLTDMISRYSLGEVLPTMPSFPIDPACALPALQTYIPTVVSALPRWHDEEEARNIHHNYVLWLKKIPQVVYGQDNAQLPECLRIYAHLCDLKDEYEIIEDDDMEYLEQWWGQMKQSLPAEIIDKMKQFIDPDFHSYLE